ncbi:hypothetical protein LJC01_00800 [Clostridiaceae bacterium OttesenSCG-928-D20]|nr:hypothetical protein [Clostridiaceae bacterium OttesenSCG-928-D20]
MIIAIVALLFIGGAFLFVGLRLNKLIKINRKDDRSTGHFEEEEKQRSHPKPIIYIGALILLIAAILTAVYFINGDEETDDFGEDYVYIPVQQSEQPE